MAFRFALPLFLTLAFITAPFLGIFHASSFVAYADSHEEEPKLEDIVRCGGPNDKDERAVCQPSDFMAMVSNIINIAIYVVAPMLAVLFIFIGGYQILTAAGSVDRVSSGRKKIIFALLGYAIILGAWLAVDEVARKSGIDNWLTDQTGEEWHSELKDNPYSSE